MLVRSAITKYVGGTIAFTHIDPDRCSILDVQEEAERIGYKSGEYNMYFLVPDSDLDGGLKPLAGNIDVMDMCAMYNGRKTILIYIEKLHLDVPMTDIEVVNDVETDMGLIN